MKVGLIGFGAIAADICHFLEVEGSIQVVAALVVPEDLDKLASFQLTTDIDEFLSFKPDIVVECAGHGAVKAFAPRVLQENLDLIVVSIGALSDPELYDVLVESSAKSTAQVVLPAGALAGIDGLAAAKISGLTNVKIRSVKPPQSWSGAAGVEGIDLGSVSETKVIFSGSARDAARLFPKNANVAATAALAGIGFDETQVELVADPSTITNTHTLMFEGEAGNYEVVIRGNPSPINPKTSQLTALSIVRILLNREAGIAI